MNNTLLSQSYYFQFNQKEEVLIFFFTFLHTHTLPTRIYITSFLMEIYIYPTGSHFFCLSVLGHHLDFQNYVRASVVISVGEDDFRAKKRFFTNRCYREPLRRGDKMGTCNRKMQLFRMQVSSSSKSKSDPIL